MREDTRGCKCAIMRPILVDGVAGTQSAYAIKFRKRETSRSELREPIAHMIVGLLSRGVVIRCEMGPDVEEEDGNFPLLGKVIDREISGSLDILHP